MHSYICMHTYIHIFSSLNGYIHTYSFVFAPSIYLHILTRIYAFMYMVVCINYNHNYENCRTNLVVATRACCRFIMSCPYGSDVQRDDALGQLAAGAYLCMYVYMYVCVHKSCKQMLVCMYVCMYVWLHALLSMCVR